MKITVFQALVMLAEKYKDDTKNEEIYKDIKSIFLTGVRTQEQKEMLNTLLKDSLFHDKEIVKDKESITNDPVRRYFESQLCNETLKNSLDRLDKNKLRYHFINVYKKLPLSLQVVIPLTVYNPFASIDGVASKKSDTASEYIVAIKQLRKDGSFESLSYDDKKRYEDRKQKMMTIVKTTHAAMAAVSQNDDAFPLPLYKKEESVYQSKHRGRMNRTDEEKNPQTVRSNNLGIMRSWMPLSRDDELFLEQESKYIRPVDKSTYVEGAMIPEFVFENLVTPFVNSISGTMLCMLRMMAALQNDENLVYQKNPEQLKEYFRSMVSYMILNSGGHSLNEFMQVLSLSEIQEEFKFVKGFNELDLKKMFQDENKDAFDNALSKTIKYNHMIQNKKNIAKEINTFAMGILKKKRSNDLKKENRINKDKLKNFFDLQKSVKSKRIYNRYFVSEQSKSSNQSHLLFIAKRIRTDPLRKHQIDLLQSIIDDSILSEKDKAVTLLAAIEIIRKQINNPYFSSRLKNITFQLQTEINLALGEHIQITLNDKKKALSNYLRDNKNNIEPDYLEKISKDVNEMFNGQLQYLELKSQAVREVEEVMKDFYLEVVKIDDNINNFSKRDFTPHAVNERHKKAYEIYKKYKAQIPNEFHNDFSLLNDYIHQSLINKSLLQTDYLSFESKNSLMQHNKKKK